MASIDLDRFGKAKVFAFGTTAAAGGAVVTINKGTAAVSTVVLAVKGSTDIAGDLNVTGSIYNALFTASYVSAILVPAYSIVTVSGEIADSSNVNHRNKILGMDISGTTFNTGGKAVYSGIIEKLSWNWSGSVLFLNGTSLSSTPPTTGFCCEIAKVLSPTSILIGIKKAILL